MKAKKHLTAVVLTMLAMALPSCGKENPEPTPEPTPEPQPLSLVGKSWLYGYEEDGYYISTTLRFITDSTGSVRDRLERDGQLIDEACDDILYQFDGFTLEGTFYRVEYPEWGVSEFTYNPDDTTLVMWGVVYHCCAK